MSRSILVDDNDSRISYSGSWFKDDTGTLNTMGNFGPPMLGTLHGTNSTASFTYTFSGTQFVVTQSNQFSNLSPTRNITCLLDNESVPVTPQFGGVNNVLLCGQDKLADTQHTFVLNVVVANQETLWFDYFAYTPSTSVPLNKEILSISNADEQVQSGLGPGWKTFSPGFQTTQPGSQFNFSFTGVSLKWYGFYDPSLPWDTSLKTATYSIDGGPPIAFNTLVDIAARTDKPTGVRYNQILFETDDLPNANHSLQVVYQGSNTSTPLTLQFLVVNPNPRDGAVTAPMATFSGPSPSSLPSSTAPALTPTGAPKKGSNVPAIVGAIFGIVTILGLGILVFLFLRRRQRQRNGYRRPLSLLTPEMAEPYSTVAHNSSQNFIASPTTTSANHPNNNAVSAYATTTTESYSGPSTVAVTSESEYSTSFSSFHPHPPTNLSTPYAPSVVELTPDGRRTIQISDTSAGGGKRAMPMHVATTVVQDEDSGLRLHQSSSNQPRVEILPPSYTAD